MFDSDKTKSKPLSVQKSDEYVETTLQLSRFSTFGQPIVASILQILSDETRIDQWMTRDYQNRSILYLAINFAVRDFQRSAQKLIDVIHTIKNDYPRTKILFNRALAEIGIAPSNAAST
jgi:hypothetical protein